MINIKRDLTVFLGLQVAAMLLALASFRLIEVRWQAALVAGIGFVALGVWMVIRTLRWPNRFRMLSFYMARVHLWLFSLPMLIVRFRHFGQDFTQVHFLGLSGPEFHKISEISYLLMVAATLIDWIRCRRQ